LVEDARSAGKLRRRIGKLDVQVSGELNDGELVGVGEPGQRFGLRPKSGAKGAKGVVAGSTVTYPAMFGEGVDLEYDVSTVGLKEQIVLASRPVGTGVVEYRFDLSLDGLTARANKNGTISLLDAASKEIYVIPLGSAWEKGAVPGRSPQSAFSSVAIGLETAGSTPVLVVRPDPTWLRDPSRKYPVIVDPTIFPGNGVNVWANYMLGSPTYLPTPASGAASVWNPPGVIPLIRYDVSPATNKKVSAGLLKVNVVQATGSWPLTVRPLASPFDPATVTGASAPALRPEYASVQVTAAGAYTINITPWVAKWASGEWPNYGLEFLTAGSGSMMFQASTAPGVAPTYLELTYSDPGVGPNNQPTTVPTSLVPAAGATVGSPVQLSATSTDPDGDPVLYLFQGSCVSACTSANVSAQFGSGWRTTNTWVISGVTPAPGEVWSWVAFSSDGVAPPQYGAAQSFTVGAPPPIGGAAESWAWGSTSAYSTVDQDVQPNSGVNTGTRRFVYSAVDEQVAWIGPQLAVNRTYNSGETTAGAFGLGWSSILDARVDIDASGNMLFRLPDGRRQYHPRRVDGTTFNPAAPSGTYATQPGYWSTASFEGFTLDRLLLEKDGSLWRFRASDGKFRSVVDRNGRSLQAVYSAQPTAPPGASALRATGAGGVKRELVFTWTGGVITAASQGTFNDSVTPPITPTTTSWNYSYVGNKLSKVCDPRNNNVTTGLCTTYLYDAGDRINKVVKPKLNNDLELLYYPDGTVNWRKDGMGNQTTFAYDPVSRTATTTDALGRVTTEVYNQFWQRISMSEPGDATIPAQQTTYTYDLNGFLSKVTNSVGSTSFANDYRGNPVRVTDANGKTSYYEYDSRDLVVAYSDARSAAATDNTYRWTYGYDSNGNRVRETNPNQWSRHWEYNTTNTAVPAGVLTKETDWNGNSTNYTYNAFGDVMSIVYPGIAGDNVTYTYDTAGRKLSEMGRIVAPGVTYTYDVLNAPLTITEPPVTNTVNGLVHRRKVTIVYDDNHLKYSEKVEDIGGSTSPDPTRITYFGYDTNDRERYVVDPLNGTTSRQFTTTGMVQSVTDAENRTSYTAYNVRDLPTATYAIQYKDPTVTTPPADRLTQSMSYDAAGRMTSQIDANGRQRVFAYDAVNRLLTRTLQSFTDRTGVARAIVEERNTWDAVGNKLTQTTGNDKDSYSMTYDVLGRVATRFSNFQPRYDYFYFDRNSNNTHQYRYNATVSVSLTFKTFDERNRPTRSYVETGNVASYRDRYFSYNKFGLVEYDTTVDAGTTTYTYDVLGRLLTKIAPTTPQYEAATGTMVSGNSIFTTGYDTFGNATHQRDARNNTTTTSYDALNRRVRVDQPTCTACATPNLGAYETWTYDKVGNTKTYRDRRGFTSSYDFDTLNQPVKTTLPPVGTAASTNRVTRFDLLGNPTQMFNEVGAQVTTVYNERNMVKEINTIDRYPAVTTSTTKFDYDDLGYVSWTRDPMGGETTFNYLTTGELTKRTDPVGAVWTAEYDSMGRKTKEQDPLGRSVVTTYDQASQPLTVARYASGVRTLLNSGPTSLEKVGPGVRLLCFV
jgi:YD repeat-containing protein